MDSLENEGTVDTKYLIRLFLDASTGEAPHVGVSLVARLTEGTIAVFRVLNRSLINGAKDNSESQSHLVSLGRSSDRLQLWSDGYGISSGALDDAFERSGRLRGATLEILCNVALTLTERLVLSTWVTGLLGKATLPEKFTDEVEQLRQLVQEADDDQPKSESSSGSSDYDDDDIKQITADLETDTRGLMDLDGLFSSPILDTGHARQSLASSCHSWEPHEPYRQLISRQFPKANKDLIASLGKANYERFLRGQEQRDKSFWALCEDPNGPLLVDPSQIRASHAASSKFTDSGLGSSIPSSYAETIMPDHGDEGTSVRLPRLPKGANTGFFCMACGIATAVRNKSEWKRHLFNDLRPWQCLEPSCRRKSAFSTRGDWVSHLHLDHFGPEWKASECMLCRKDTGSGKTAVLKHLGGHLKEISLAALPSNPNSDTESQHSDTSQQDESFDSETEETDPAAQIGVAGLPGTADHGQNLVMEQEGPVTLKELIDFCRRFKRQKPNLHDDLMPLLMAHEKKSIQIQEFHAGLRDIFSDAPDFRLGQRFEDVFIKFA